MAGTWFKARPVPPGCFAMGERGRAVNVSAATRTAVWLEGARQRHVWNRFLGLNVERYAADGTFVFYPEMAKLLTKLRAEDKWFAAGGVAAQQQTLRDLDKALRDSFPGAKNRSRFP